MKKKVIDSKKYPPKCGYCLNGRISPDGENVLCRKKGIVNKDSSCSSYKYDVLKRKPPEAKLIDDIDPGEFKL
ncbi:MAG: hypothetical protein K6F64_04825 [Clostridia bacterium]|nr:hypothetical protein [Clostridia bacterium]